AARYPQALPCQDGLEFPRVPVGRTAPSWEEHLQGHPRRPLRPGARVHGVVEYLGPGAPGLPTECEDLTEPAPHRNRPPFVGSAFQFAVTVPLLCRNQPCGRFQVKKYCASNAFTSPSVPPVNDQAFSNNTPTVSGFG